jgi:hypothetical protein
MAFTPKLLQQGASGASGYQISRSLRFNSADSAYLNRTPSASNRTAWTYSAWIKMAKTTGYQYFFGGTSDNYGNNFTLLQMNNNGSDLAFYDVQSGTTSFDLRPTPVYRDPSAWYHFVLVYDSNNATSSDRARIYVNGSRVTAFNSATYPTSGKTSVFNSAVTHTISASPYGADCYMTEINMIDGQALTPSSFGETNAQTGVWRPKKYSGSYGTNGFYLNFSDNSNTTAATLGKDYSGNGNNWTPNNFSVTAGAGNDSLVDSPTSYGTDTGAGGSVRGNYCTFNPLVKPYGTNTFTNGNLDVSIPVSNWNAVVGTIALTTGKWYWEIISGEQNLFIGIQQVNQDYTTINPQNFSGIFLCDDNKIMIDGGTRTSYTATGHGPGVVVGVAVDLDAGSINFYLNGTAQGSVSFTGSTAYGKSVLPTIIPYFSGYTHSANFGQRAFSYTAPTGYKALCTQNLPSPAIAQGNKYMDASTYTGNGTSQSLTLGFQPDFTWFKARNIGYSSILTNSVTGGSNYLVTSSTAAEQGGQSLVTSWTSTGVNIGSWIAVNESTITFVAWNWKAGGTAVTNTTGSITSSVSANPTSGFSIVTWTGTGTGSTTVGHGLSTLPQFVIIKKRNTTSDWYVASYASGQGLNYAYHLFLDTTGALSSNNDPYYLGGQASLTSNVLAIAPGTSNTGGNENGTTYVAYCWTPIEGYSAFGSYTGNGSTDGPFVYTGFKPRFVMIKDATTASTQWTMLDSARNNYNVVDARLIANLSNAENAQNFLDFTSNGFKLRDTYSVINQSGATLIYMAFAENPFKYSLAR